MPKINVYHHSFAGGVADKGILPRTDLAMMQLAAEEQTNLLCLATGRGFFRPGTEYLGTSLSNARARIKEFVFSASDACMLEFTDNAMRVWADDQLVSRPAVTSTITNGGFGSATGWTDDSTAGASAAVAGGLLALVAEGRGSEAVFKQQVTTSTPNVEHGLRIVIDLGPVIFRCGSTDGGDEYISETELKTGVHSLAFTPTGSYWVQFRTDDPVLRYVDSITVEPAGPVSIPTEWDEGDLELIRSAQSADVVFVTCRGRPQARIERRGVRGASRSWSVVRFNSDFGPFTAGRTARVKLAPNAVTGNVTVTADNPFFRPQHVGALIKLNHTGQTVNHKLSGPGQFTDAIEVTGINNSEAEETFDRYDDREWFWSVGGTWAGTIKVFRSFDGPDFGFKEYRAADGAATIPITSNATGQRNTDSDNNAQVWYRLGFDEGDYTSGTATVSMFYKGGGGSGIGRITTYNSPTSVGVEVTRPFKGITPTDDWQEGQWSAWQGFPTAISLFEGRLWQSGADRFWGSVSDDFENYDEDAEGDAGPINRVVATNGVNDTQWMLALQRLVIGTEGTETSARSSSFDEPLTPTNLTLKDSSTVGSAAIEPARVDGRALFVDRSGQSLFELIIDADSADYAAFEITKIVKDLFSVGVGGLTVQRRPDTRVWVWLDDGRAVCLVYEPSEKVTAFIPVETDGEIESIAVLPAAGQDRVYWMVKRTVGGNAVRYFERMALDTESRPDTLCKVTDSSITFTNSPASATVSGLGHLVGKTVVVWADGAPLTQVVNGREVARTFVVSGAGTITLPAAASTGVVGLPYSWRYKSARLAYGAAGGTAMLQDKKVSAVGLIMTDFVRAGVRYGAEFDNPHHPMKPLPTLVGRKTAPAIVTGDVTDEEPLVLDSPWELDSRVCLEGSSPFPVSLLGMVLSVTTHG